MVLLKSALPDGGVEAARGVVLKRACPQTGVALRRSNPRQRERENERSNKDGEKRSSVGRMAETYKTLLILVIVELCHLVYCGSLPVVQSLFPCPLFIGYGIAGNRVTSRIPCTSHACRIAPSRFGLDWRHVARTRVAR